MKKPWSRRAFLASTAATVLSPALAGARTHDAGLLGFLANGVPDGNQGAGGQGDGISPDKWKDAGVVDTSHSPYAKLHPVPVRAVTVEEGFWSKRRKTNLEASIPSMREELLAHGRMDNFLRLENKSSEPQKGPVYSDSDIYKWTEAVGFALQSGDQPQLRETTETMIRQVVASQEPSGYLNTYFVGDRAAQRMQYNIQTTGHELYCLGH